MKLKYRSIDIIEKRIFESTEEVEQILSRNLPIFNGNAFETNLFLKIHDGYKLQIKQLDDFLLGLTSMKGDKLFLFKPVGYIKENDVNTYILVDCIDITFANGFTKMKEINLDGSTVKVYYLSFELLSKKLKDLIRTDVMKLTESQVNGIFLNSYTMANFSAGRMLRLSRLMEYAHNNNDLFLISKIMEIVSKDLIKTGLNATRYNSLYPLFYGKEYSAYTPSRTFYEEDSYFNQLLIKNKLV